MTEEEIITYDGVDYVVHEFTNESKHVEPCGECCWGRKVMLGITKQCSMSGEMKDINVGGVACYKPRGFAYCTAVNREDERNVYFTIKEEDEQ